MITSEQIQNLSIDDFTFLYSQCVINREIELIIGKVFEEQYIRKNKMLMHDLRTISELYHLPIRDNIKLRMQVSSVYIQNETLYIDWSL